MRLFLAGVLATIAFAAAPLEVLQPVISQSDGGTPLPPGFTHVPGEILFLAFQIGGFQPTAENKIHLSYTINAVDPAGVKIMEPVESVVDTELAPQDKEWKPKIRHEIAIPPLAPSGTYKVIVQVKDDVSHAETRKEIGFDVRGREVAPSDTLVVRNFRFFRGENDEQPLEKAAYRPGDSVWARFDITGYKFGPNNAVDVSYGVAVVVGDKVLWSQPDAAVEKTESFYPKRYVPGSMSINLQPKIRPGEYTLAVQVRDLIGNQTCEAKANFLVE